MRLFDRPTEQLSHFFFIRFEIAKISRQANPKTNHLPSKRRWEKKYTQWKRNTRIKKFGKVSTRACDDTNERKLNFNWFEQKFITWLWCFGSTTLGQRLNSTHLRHCITARFPIQSHIPFDVLFRYTAWRWRHNTFNIIFWQVRVDTNESLISKF